MTVNVFTCSKDAHKFGLTTLRDGSNLPADRCKGSWTFLQAYEIDSDSTFMLVSITGKEIVKFIEDNGFCIITTNQNIE